MFIPPKVSRVSENFGGINMDLSALRTLEYANTEDVEQSEKPGCNVVTMPGQRQGRLPAAESAVSADAGAHRR